MKKTGKKTKISVGIIGAGNMGEAIIKGLAEKNISAITVYEKNKSRLNLIAKKYGARKKSIGELTKTCDTVIICVKPQNAEEVFAELKSSIRAGSLVMSIAAGISTSRIEKELPRKIPVIRVMPNMPGLIGQGVTAYCLGSSAGPKHARLAELIFSAIGTVLKVTEKKMDAVTALSGSGPGFLAYVIDSLKQAGISAGLNAKEAESLAVNTAAGTGSVLKALNLDPAELVKKVASKGGTTEAGLKVLKENKLAAIIGKTVKAAAKRSKELSK